MPLANSEWVPERAICWVFGSRSDLAFSIPSKIENANQEILKIL